MCFNTFSKLNLLFWNKQTKKSGILYLRYSLKQKTSNSNKRTHTHRMSDFFFWMKWKLSYYYLLNGSAYQWYFLPIFNAIHGFSLYVALIIRFIRYKLVQAMAISHPATIFFISKLSLLHRTFVVLQMSSLNHLKSIHQHDLN